jgi:curved DNA-binding protein CbpA
LKKSLYDVLQVSKLAELEVIEAACQRLISKFEADHSLEAQNQLKFIRHAYEILSDPAQRAFYDQNLKEPVIQPKKLAPNSEIYTSQYKSDFAESFDSWWSSSKVTWIIVAAVALIGFSLYTKHTGEKNKVEIVNTIETTRRQADEFNAVNQTTLVTGAVDVAQQQEERRRIEMQYRADENARMIDLRRRELESRLESQRLDQQARLEAQRKQQADRDQRAEDQRIEREKRYYVCMNSALNNYTSAQANTMCRR